MSFINVSGGGVWKKIRKDISASATVTVDSLPMTGFNSLTYVINGYNSTNDESKYLATSILKDSSTTVKTSRFAIVPNGLSISIDESIAAGTLSYNITNNEAFDITVDVARMKLG